MIDRIYNKVHFVDNQYGWVVGEYGVILHTNDGGQTWIEQQHNLGEITFFSLDFKDKNHGWVTGMGGRMLMTTDGGNHWEEVTTPVDSHLFDIDFTEGTGYAVGYKGVLLVNNNSTWMDQTEKIPTRSWLKDVTFVDEKRGWSVGSVGVVLHTNDSGQSWTRFPDY